VDIAGVVSRYLSWLPQGAASKIFRSLTGVPFIRKAIDREMQKMMADLEATVKPYGDKVPSFSRLPSAGMGRESILTLMNRINDQETAKWKDGFVSGAVYHGDAAHIDFLNRVYSINSQSNPLHSDIWPSAAKYESEIVAMAAGMLGAEQTEDEVCGVVSSGGTESILLAMKTYRDRAREERRITRPEMVAPATAHAAFDKAAQYFGIKMVHVPVGEDCRADVGAAREAITKNTIVMIGSAPSFPHGVVDPIAELSEIARKRGIGFHTDACLGGFVLPWAERLGYDVPAFDFRLPGVTSISADTHKYGYAAKGTSVILYRGQALRHYQYFTSTDWPGGLYFSPSFAGSRPGALSAACWAAMVAMGEKGYLEATDRILRTASQIKEGIKRISDLHILGDPLWVIAFSAKDLNIYQVMERMGQNGWSLNGLHRPACVHLCVTLRHTQPGVADRFIADLRVAVEHVRAHPREKGQMAPVYGMAAAMPFRGLVGDMLKRYIDLLYRVK
jgi:sphinganine-1-phosphate aldolase